MDEILDSVQAHPSLQGQAFMLGHFSICSIHREYACYVERSCGEREKSMLGFQNQALKFRP